MNGLLLNSAKPGAFLFILLLLVTSCSDDPQGLENLEPVCFNTEILPLIQNSCAVSGCHDVATHEEGYTFTTYENIMAVVKPGQAKQSKLYKVLTDINGEMMPPHQPLSMQDRNLIKVWIEQGAKNTICTVDNN